MGKWFTTQKEIAPAIAQKEIAPAPLSTITAKDYRNAMTLIDDKVSELKLSRREYAMLKNAIESCYFSVVIPDSGY